MKKFFDFLSSHLLKSWWFWAIVGLAIIAVSMQFVAPKSTWTTTTGTLGQVVLGIAISPFIIALAWIIILTNRARGEGGEQQFSFSPSWNWGKAIAAVILIIVGYWWVQRVPGDTIFIILLVGFILATMWWKQVFKFLGVSIVLGLLLGITGYFYTCSRGVQKLHAQYQAEMEEARKERASRFPIAGNGTATDSEPVKAWIDPMVTHGRGTKPVKYVLAKDPSKVYFGSGTAGSRWPMPVAGSYLVYPQQGGEVKYTWWQGNSPPEK